MIAVITCACGGADRMAREALRKGGVENPIEFPITKSKNSSLAVLESLKPEYGDLTDFKVLVEHVKRSGRFVVVIGYSSSEHIMRWADVSRGTLKEKLDGEILVSEFKDRK